MSVLKLLAFGIILFVITSILMSMSVIRSQQQKIYELDQRVFYLEDVVTFYIYGPVDDDDKEVDFNNY